MMQVLNPASEGERRRPIRVLLVEDNPIDARLMAADFRRLGSTDFELMTVARLSDAMCVMRETAIDVVLLDLFLEDTAGLETLSKLHDSAPSVPVVVLTGLNDETQALQALKNGAQDYLIKGSVDGGMLLRAIRYSIVRGQLEQRLFEKQRLEAIGTLAGGVAHNFNNLLTIILGNCSLMLEQMDPSNKNLRNAEAIKNAADRAAVLTRQLLAFSRKQRVAPTVIDVNKSVENMRLLLESVLGESIQLELKLAPNLDLIKAGQGQMEQIIMNLAVNARDAMNDGGRLTVETVESDSGGSSGEQKGREVVLRITDTGCGMSAETCRHIFEPFFTTKGPTQASGLGLSSVYGMVKENGGNTEASSTLGSGSTFSVTFPVWGASSSESSEISDGASNMRRTMLVPNDEESREVSSDLWQSKITHW